MSNVTQATSYTKIKQPTDHDSRNFGPLVHGHDPQTSTANQTIINLTQFVCDLANKSQVMVYLDGNLLREGVGNDYVWVPGVNNTSSQLTLAVSIPAGLNIQLYKIGAPRVSLPTADSINATINLVQLDNDKQSQQYIANGAFDFWQEGTSFAAIADGTYFADQWTYTSSGTMVHTVSRSTNLPSTSKSKYSALVDCTTVDSSIGAGDFVRLIHRVEGNILRSFRGKNMVLAFNVYSTKTGTFCTSFRNGNASRSLVKEYTVNASNTHQRVYIRFNHDETGTWDYENALGLMINFVLACGSTFQTTADTWQTGNYFATSNQVNACDSTSNDFIISDVVLMEDNASLNRTPEQYKYFNGSYNAELQLIERYFERGDVGDGKRTLFSGRVVSGSSYQGWIGFRHKKRVSPSISLTHQGALGFAAVAGSIGLSGVDGFTESRNANSTVDGGIFTSSWTANARM